MGSTASIDSVHSPATVGGTVETATPTLPAELDLPSCLSLHYCRKHWGASSLYCDGLFQEVLVSSGNRGLPVPEVQQVLAGRRDVYFSHDYGRRLSLDSYARAEVLRRELLRSQLSVWFNDLGSSSGEGIADHCSFPIGRSSDHGANAIQQAVHQQIDNSTIVLVFITQKYIERLSTAATVNTVSTSPSPPTPENITLQEFEYAAKTKTRKRMLAVVLERRMRNVERWCNTMKLILGEQPYIDLCGDLEDSLYLMGKVVEVKTAILKLIGAPLHDLIGVASNSSREALLSETVRSCDSAEVQSTSHTYSTILARLSEDRSNSAKWLPALQVSKNSCLIAADVDSLQRLPSKEVGRKGLEVVGYNCAIDDIPLADYGSDKYIYLGTDSAINRIRAIQTWLVSIGIPTKTAVKYATTMTDKGIFNSELLGKFVCRSGRQSLQVVISMSPEDTGTVIEALQGAGWFKGIEPAKVIASGPSTVIELLRRRDPPAAEDQLALLDYLLERITSGRMKINELSNGLEQSLDAHQCDSNFMCSENIIDRLNDAIGQGFLQELMELQSSIDHDLKLKVTQLLRILATSSKYLQKLAVSDSGCIFTAYLLIDDNPQLVKTSNGVFNMLVRRDKSSVINLAKNAMFVLIKTIKNSNVSRTERNKAVTVIERLCSIAKPLSLCLLSATNSFYEHLGCINESAKDKGVDGTQALLDYMRNTDAAGQSAVANCIAEFHHGVKNELERYGILDLLKFLFRDGDSIAKEAAMNAIHYLTSPPCTFLKDICNHGYIPMIAELLSSERSLSILHSIGSLVGFATHFVYKSDIGKFIPSIIPRLNHIEAFVVMQALDLLYQLSLERENCMRIVQNDGVEPLLALILFNDQSNTSEEFINMSSQSANILGELCKIDHHKEIIAEFKGVTILAIYMENSRYYHDLVSAAAALSKLASGSYENQVEIARHGIIPECISLLTSNTSCSEFSDIVKSDAGSASSSIQVFNVVQSTLELLVALLDDNIENGRIFVRGGGISAVVNVLVESTDEVIAVAACSVLSLIANWSEGLAVLKIADLHFLPKVVNDGTPLLASAGRYLMEKINNPSIPLLKYG